LFKINLKGIQLTEENGGVDWPHLVKLTEGYSGADISNVCRDAAMMPMRRKMQSSHFDINNLQNIQEEIDIPLTMQDFIDALKNISKSVSQD
jgi:katanin p60 ATPase-containing subunit A1